jgi:hypothetical protein
LWQRLPQSGKKILYVLHAAFYDIRAVCGRIRTVPNAISFSFPAPSLQSHIDSTASRGEIMKSIAFMLIAALAAIPAVSQTATQKLQFEVASIKPHIGAVTFSADPTLRGSRVSGTASTLADMITVAYGTRYDQISNGPGWINSDRFDIEAKTPGDAPPAPEQVHLMMQNLLAERFQLRLHQETLALAEFANDRWQISRRPGLPKGYL